MSIGFSGPVLLWDERNVYPSNLDPAIAVQAGFSRPDIDSIWLAKDGRRVRVCRINETRASPDGWWAELFVLPPYAHRQRRWTRAQAWAFTSGFYKLESL